MNGYDARVGFLPRHGLPETMYALVKQTWTAGRLVETEPLTADLLRPDAPSDLEIGSDCWIERPWTDVIVLGEAHAQRAVSQMTVSVEVGKHCKRIAVFGRRTLKWTAAGSPAFSKPDPFTTMTMGWDRAYGGVDLRTPVPVATSAGQTMERWADHPGLYPRNPYGRGYIVQAGPVAGLELPNLEDPCDLLTPERLIVGDPARWWWQPAPATVGYTPTNVFSRYVLGGGQPWFAAPDDERLAEVRVGRLPAGYHRLLEDRGLHPSFWQESAPGLSFASLEPGTPIIVRGMHPGGKPLRVSVPRPPRIAFDLEGHRERARPKLDKIVLYPERETMTVTWSTRSDRMHRVFVPGVHASIPLSVQIDNDTPVPYVTPIPTRARIDKVRLPDVPQPRRARSVDALQDGTA